MKRFFTFLALFSLFAPVASASFTDVSSLHYNNAAINELVDQGVLVGYEDETFRPEDSVNRAEAVKIVLLGMGIEVDEESVAGLLFSDVAEDDWFFGVVSTAVSEGIISGYDDGSFKPEQTVNRAEAIKMLMLAAGVTLDEVNAAPFADLSVNDWFVDYAAYAKEFNIEPPETDGLWYPGDAVSRANISEMVYRMQIVLDDGESFDESRNWLRHDFPTVDISLKTPFGWNYKQEGVGAVWLLDDENGQLSLLNPYENGGTLLMTRNRNLDGLSSSELFDEISVDAGRTPGTETIETSISGMPTLIVNEEWYVYLPNNSLVHFVSMKENGLFSEWIDSYFDGIVFSIEYEEDGSSDFSIADTIAALRSSIQVDDIGEQSMELLSDWELIETDTIGVGTGPVDYFYSPSANITIKYERSFDVILDLKEGQTSAF